MKYFCHVQKTLFILAFFILFKPLFPIVEYFANYDYISKVLCENKDKPALKCNGKCHLMKEMAKASEGEKPNDKKVPVKEVELLFFQEIQSLTFLNLPLIQKLEVNTTYSNLYSYLDCCSDSRPPNFPA